MKKKLFTLLAALLCGTLTSFAQPAAKTKRLTAKAGITYPMIHDMDVRGSQGQNHKGQVPWSANNFMRIIWRLQNKYVILQAI